MCSHYQTLKDAELLLKKFGASSTTRAGGGAGGSDAQPSPSGGLRIQLNVGFRE